MSHRRRTSDAYPVSSRGIAAVVAAATLALVMLASCSSAPPPVVGEVPVPAPAPQIEPDPSQLRLGVDDLGTGFNPHRLSDRTPTSRATADLVLPSVFRVGPDGSRTLDTTVVTSAEVTSTSPFTVSYEIAAAATWSDNSPVAAEDFLYLWEQMRTQPAVLDAAGYRAVSEVRSRAGGKAVDVVFDRPYPAWRTLFDHLLPSHLLKDAPGAWGGALMDSIPVSAGPFVVRVVDRIRGQVTLARNDRFWGTPAVPDEIVLQAADHPSLIDRVRTGDVQATQFRANGADLESLAAAGDAVTTQVMPEPALVQLVLRSDDGPLADVRVRRAVAAVLDRDALVAAGASGGPAAGLRADAHATAPSAEGYEPTLPPDSPVAVPRPDEAAALLGEAGYVRGDDGRWARDGTPLVLRLAAPPQVAPFGRLMTPLASQLETFGIDSVVVADAGANPFPPGRGPIPSTEPAPAPSVPGQPAPTTPPTSTTAPGTTSTTTSVPPIPNTDSDMVVADLTVLALPVGGDPIADLVSVVGCPGRAATTTAGTTAASLETGDDAVPTTTAPPSPAAQPVGPGGAPVPAPNPAPTTSATTTTTSLPDELVEPEPSESLSVSGWCDPTLQSLLDAAAAGTVNAETALAIAEPTLWSALPTIPLFQAASVLVSRPERTEAVVGPLTTNPFAEAARWVPSPRSTRDDDGVN